MKRIIDRIPSEKTIVLSEQLGIYMIAILRWTTKHTVVMMTTIQITNTMKIAREAEYDKINLQTIFTQQHPNVFWQIQKKIAQQATTGSL